MKRAKICNPMVHALILASLALLLNGCLQTRSDVREVEEKQVLQKQVSNLQHSSADINSRFQDIDEEFRKVNGRVEILDNKIGTSSGKNEKVEAAREARIKEITDRMAIYQEAITKLEATVAELNQQVAQHTSQIAGLGQESGHHASAGSASSGSASSSGSGKGPYAMAEEQYEKKQWRDAVLNFEKYRKSTPSGRNFAAATFKIGVCFQELGDNDAAKAFFDEVIQKFPKSADAGKAKVRLKSLKKN